MLAKGKTLFVSMTVLGMLAGSFGTVSAAAAPASTEQQLKDIKELLSDVHLNGQDLTHSQYATIEDTLKSLNDPYTDYFNEEEWNAFQNSLQLNYAGIGMRIDKEEGGVIAVEVFRDSPAEAAGLQRGDLIIQVGTVSTANLRVEQVTQLIRGEEGTEISIRVRRGDQEWDVKPKRKQIQLPVVKGGMMEGNIGYLDIDSFSADADEIFAKMLDQLKTDQLKGLVVDLRDNPGGLLDTAQHIAEQFISRGILIHTRDKNNVDEPVLIRNGKTVSFPVVILVNENSASASELLTAALQDYKKAIAVGEKTYGKGSVQALYELSSGGVLKVTVQEYLSPNKRTVNHVGVMPDIVADGVVPQLLTALREAGADKLHVEAGKHSYRVNGLEFFDAAITALNENGNAFLPARLLASAVGLPLAWDEAAAGVRIGEGNESQLFDAANGFVISGGTGYIDLSRFSAAYPQAQWSADAEQTVFTVNVKGK
jgi:carboxyl-terminal processing protease